MNQTEKTNNHLLRRVLVPLLIVALPIASMVAYILYSKQARRPAVIPSPPQQAVSFGDDSWPIFRGDAALTGRAAGTLPDKLTLAWKFQTEDAVRSTPIVAEGKVFVSSMDEHLYALDLKTGREIWKFAADDDLEASPLYHNGVVYVGSDSGTFYAVSAADGQPAWTSEAGGRITGSANIAVRPETNQKVIVFGCYDNNLYCLDAETGKPIFEHPAESYINGSIAVANNAAFFGSCDTNIYQVPIADPSSVKKIEAGSYVAASPVIDNNVIFAGSFDGIFLAADATKYETLWQFDEGEDAFFSSPAVNENIVVVGCRDRNVYCLDRQTGNKRGRFSAQENFDSSPVICGDKVAIGCDDGRLYILDIETGQEVFSYTLGSPVLSSPAIAQNHLFIGCDNGIVYAFVGE